MFVKKYLLLVLICSLVFVSVGYAQNSPFTAETFGRLPDIRDIEISPNGDRLLLLQNYQGRTILVTKPLVADGTGPYGIPIEEGEFRLARWVSNDKIVFSVAVSSHRGVGWRGADTTETRLFIMDWDGKNLINAYKRFYGVRNGLAYKKPDPQIQDRIIDYMTDDPDHILLQLDIEQNGKASVYEVNVHDRKRDRVVLGRENIQTWQADHNHEVRFGEGRSTRGTSGRLMHTALYKKSVDDNWSELFKFDVYTETKPFSFTGFSANPNEIYIEKQNEHNRSAYYRYNVDTKEIVAEIAGSEDVDIDNITLDQDGNVRRYTYYDETRKIVRVDEHGKRINKVFEANFPNQLVGVISQTPDKQVMVIRVSSPTNPGAFYVLDLNRGTMDLIGYNYETLPEDGLSEMTPITYAARDGLEINGYLSLPRGSDGKNLPTIIMPHGGPQARDNWGFDYWVQFLTTRGYAVLQMNYRGSTGYGAGFEGRGFREWGRKMLEDINDGTKWMIEEGYADPDRICMVGGSYGGYAALQGIVKDPSLYKCSVSFAPVADLRMFKEYRERYTGYKTFANYFISEDWTLKDASPSENPGKLNVPILLIHGDIDRNVRVEQSREFYKIMKEAGKDIKYVEFEGGNHYLSKEVNRIEFLRQLEHFLKEQL